MNNNQGITAEQARFFKLGIDMVNNQSPFEKYLAKQDISALIVAPIDRESELRNDEADYGAECARNSAHRLERSPLIAPLLDSAITFCTEACKQQIACAAEDSHAVRDSFLRQPPR